MPGYKIELVALSEARSGKNGEKLGWTLFEPESANCKYSHRNLMFRGIHWFIMLVFIIEYPN